MKVSIVLTTYNGEKYLYELLDSLRTQTHQPDEVFICDDGSSDNTRAMIVEYIERNNLNSWKAVFNPANKGWKKNFRDGILMATGDYVFPCDQDDIWEKYKIERMITVMEQNANILLLSSDYLPIYEEGGQVVEQARAATDELEYIPFSKHFAVGNKPGCVMCISRKLIEERRLLWEDWYPHDAFLWTSAVFMNGCYILHESLIRYRRHDGNATNHETRDKKAVILSLKRNTNLVEHQLGASRGNVNDKHNSILEEYKEYAQLRIELLEKRKILNFFKLIRYRGFYRSIKQELGDLYLLVQ